MAAPDAFRAAGVDYNPVLPGLTVTLEARPDGRPFLRLTSDRAVHEPFVDVILETTWASGRLVRDYTMLFDPPTPAPEPRRRRRAPACRRPRRLHRSGPVAPAARRAHAARRLARPPQRPPAPAPARRSGRAAPAAPAQSAIRSRCRPATRAGRIAGAAQAGSVSLDQMLVALLRGNPDAFIDDNMNRLQAPAPC